MKADLQEFCSSINIQYVGIAPIGPYLALEQLLRDRMEKGHYTEFEEECLAKRIDPRLTMADVQSVIVCLFPYYAGEKAESNLAKYTYSLDYHAVAKDKLKKIGTFLTKAIPGFHYQAFVDTGPLVDRYLAYLAGLGFYGQNSHIITDTHGSYVLIGYMLTNHPFEIDKPLEQSCMQCGKCIRTCPGQAIHGDFGIDPRRCRSYLTQKKGDLTAAEINIVKKSKLVFGCDICQDVCPHNQKGAVTRIAEFQENIIPELSYAELSAMSNKEFMRRYGNRAFSWRGRKLIIRNFEYLL
ncbi:MAG: tRNA epoxyqueuosine(34) reductase QueG [Sporomusaceae bacterium]|nr:tRNA epoxyqueuosine(34) reductase QueG [Sporomusaceae bacterium]